MHRHTKDIRQAPIKEIMTEDFYRLDKDSSIKEVLELFDEHETECFAVVDQDDNFLGDVHERDLIKFAINPKYMSEHDIIGYLGTKIDESYFADDVKDIMETHEVTASPQDKVEEVVLEMWKEGLRSIPVIEENKIKGIVFDRDVIDKVVERLRLVEE